MIPGQPSSLSFGLTAPLSFSLLGFAGGVFLLTIDGYLLTLDGNILTIQ